MTYGHGQAGGAADEPRMPVCPRHPDRIAYVSCQRCQRPACPECQRPAPVGVQCVDCVRQTGAAARPTRTALGGRYRGGRPVITLTLIIACVVVYLGQRFAQLSITQVAAFVPVLGETEPWRFLTAAFLHGGFLHLVLNMYALWILGTVLEPILGRWRFLALYGLAALGGSVAVLLLASPLDPSWARGVVGASGAVFGLFAAVFIVLRRFGRDATQILLLLVVNFAIGFFVPLISWEAHAGGLAVGAVLAVAYVYAPRQRRLLLGVTATVAVAVLLVLLIVLRYAFAYG